MLLHARGARDLHVSPWLQMRDVIMYCAPVIFGLAVCVANQYWKTTSTRNLILTQTAKIAILFARWIQSICFPALGHGIRLGPSGGRSAVRRMGKSLSRRHVYLPTNLRDSRDFERVCMETAHTATRTASSSDYRIKVSRRTAPCTRFPNVSLTAVDSWHQLL